jgi:non-specific serine/threonine protein kinase
MQDDRADEALIGSTVTPFLDPDGRYARSLNLAPVGWRPGSTPKHNLPVALTRFIGRQQEAAAVARLLATTRLLTLTGPPGVGKTRLALEVASDLVCEFADGVWLVELASLSDPALVPQAVAATLGVRERPDRTLLATLTESLYSRQMLLLLDNCEHLLEASATLSDSLLRACPGPRIIATSREALGTDGETLFSVPTLTLPDPERPRQGERPVDSLLASEAGSLFAERARAVLPTFQVMDANATALAQVCRRLDGIPLALELAAARVTALTPAQLAQRLDDCFRVLTVGRRTALPRQQTLRATLDWSYELLDERERCLLQRLSVFTGGWSLEAAEGVCASDELPVSEVLPLLAVLVDKSLVQVNEQDGMGGYRLLDTVRQYASQKLRESGEQGIIQDRHLSWYVTRAEQAEEPLWSADQVAWFARLKADEDNLREALAWSVASAARPDSMAAVEAGLRLGGALWHFWNLRGHLSEGSARLVELLATGVGSPGVRAKALHAAAYLTFLQGNPREASRLAGEAVRLGRDVVNPFLVASSLVGLATGALVAGDLDRAAALCGDGLALCRQAGDRRGMYYSLYGLMEVARAQRDHQRAIALMEEAYSLTREQGDPWSIAFALSILGNLVLLQGEMERAEALQRESLVLRQATEDVVGTGRCLDSLGWVASAQRQPARATRLFGAAELLCERVGVAPHPPWRAEHERHVATARASLGDEAFAAAWAEGRALSLDEAIAYALTTEAPVTATTSAVAQPAPRTVPGGLSPRERDVARLIAQGQTNRQIAETLVIAEWTVDTHVRHILTKLTFRSRAQVAAWATEHGLTDANG